MCEKKLCHLRGSCIILQAVWCDKQVISRDICKNGKRTKSITELQKEGRFQDGNLKKAIISMRVARFKNHLIEAKCNRIVFRTCSIETPGKVSVKERRRHRSLEKLAFNFYATIIFGFSSSDQASNETCCRNLPQRNVQKIFFDGTPDKSSKKFYFQNARKKCRVKSSTVSSSLSNSCRGNLYLQDVIGRRHCKL